jgi:hypothetical protein
MRIGRSVVSEGAPVTTPAELELDELRDEAQGYAERSRAVKTVRGYRSDWRIFDAWCTDHDLPSMSAARTTVVLFLTDSARTVRAATLRRRLSSNAVAHELAGHPNPCHDPPVRTTWKVAGTVGL